MNALEKRETSSPGFELRFLGRAAPQGEWSVQFEPDVVSVPV